MAKSMSFNKRELEKKKEQKRQEKQKRKEERRANGSNGSFEDMIAYVDENGVITSTPPDLSNRQKVEAEDITISTPKKEDLIDPVLKGYVEFFNPDKGYGFIKHAGSTDKYFFHVSSAPPSITDGNEVTFELERGQKGMNAVRIALVNKNNR